MSDVRITDERILAVCERARLFLGGEWMRAQDIVVTREAWELCHRLREPRQADLKSLKQILFKFDFSREETLRKERNEIVVALKHPGQKAIGVTPSVNFRSEKISTDNAEPEWYLGSLSYLAGQSVGEKYGEYRERSKCREGRKFRKQAGQLGIGPVTGKVGETHTVTVRPSTSFRVEKLIATNDSGDSLGTVIKSVFVGAYTQLPYGNNGIPTSAFSPNALGNGVMWTICPPGVNIVMEIAFNKSCTWGGVFFGTMMVETPEKFAIETDSLYLTADEIYSLMSAR